MKRALEFLRLVDPHDGQLSLSNIAVWVVLAKVALIRDAGMVDVGALLVAMLNYAYKRRVNSIVEAGPDASPVDAKVAEVEARLEDIASKVNAQQIALGIRKLGE